MKTDYDQDYLLKKRKLRILQLPMLTNAEAQEAELQSIEAIFPEIFHLIGEKEVSLRFDSRVRLDVTLTEDYPALSPPNYILSCPTFSLTERASLNDALQETYVENIGEPLLYKWVEVVFNLLKDQEENEPSSKQEDSSTVVELPSPESRLLSWSSGESITEKKSTFQAHIAPVQSLEEVKEVLRQLKSCNKIARATHNIYAFRLRIVKEGKEFQCADCEDDGEHGASAKMLQVLNKMNANNLIVVVSRWYGGIHLGPDRFRIINNLTREIVDAHPLLYEHS